MSRIDQPRMIRALRRYFASGWAFLIPYLAAYLLYYATDWPVNPASDAESGDIPASAMPSLLHVYWVLHVLHLALGAVALWASPSAKSAERKVKGEKNAPGGDNLGPALHHQPLRAMSSELLATIIRRFHSLFTLHSSLFWLLLALIFYIPGVYLEWPSDPWEHLRRINEWHATATVGGHSCWYKSAYFIPYSLLSWATGLKQLFWLDFYYTGICLLLCWQYYRLARACGLGERASMIFVLTQAILFGNNIFSFYRYYGISSSIYAQIGAVAITRIALEFAAKTKTNQHDNRSPLSAPSAQAFSHWPTLLKAILPAIACLVPFVAFNHQQGIGIAALGVLAIVIWRTIEWKRSAIWWLIAGTLIFNALFLWIYPRPPVIEIYRTNGALNAWYGFNIFDFTHPIGDRMLQIVSAFGLVNILAALLILRRNHVSAWLTITPLIALSLPCISIPFATVLAHDGADIANIITFQRMLFAIPVNLTLLIVAGQIPPPPRPFPIVPAFIITSLFVLIPPCKYGYNRVWHGLVTLAKDLKLSDIPELSDGHISAEVGTRASSAIHAFNAPLPLGAQPTRQIGQPTTEVIEDIMATLGIEGPHDLRHSGPVPTPGELPLPPIVWLTLAGQEAVTKPFPRSSFEANTLVQNPPGKTSYVFTSDLLPVERTKSYRIVASVRRININEAATYLAVAWYNEKGQLLESNIPAPAGANNPSGWKNGTYSYFGLISQSPPQSWTTYEISFGAFHAATIPRHARFIRIGALLNYSETAEAIVQLSGVRLSEMDRPHPQSIRVVMAASTGGSSYASQAAMLSGHWPPQQVMLDHSGSTEIIEATHSPK